MRHHDLGLRSGGVGSLALSRFFTNETTRTFRMLLTPQDRRTGLPSSSVSAHLIREASASVATVFRGSTVAVQVGR